MLDKSKVKKILIIRPDELGDVILSLPLVTQMKTLYPESEIYYLCAEYTKPILSMHSGITGTITDPFNKGKTFKGMTKFVKKLRDMSFDIVFHCYNEFPYSWACKMAGIPIRVGDSSKVAPRFCHTKIAYQGFRNILNHEVDINLSLLNAIGINPPKQGEFGLVLGDVLRNKEYPFIATKYIIVHPGLGKGNRALPDSFFIELFSLIDKRGFNMVITGANKEIKRNRLLSKSNPNIIDLSGKTNLVDLAFVIKFAKAFVSVDTGPMHLAAALSTPVILLSPSKYVKPNRWGPYGVANEVIRGGRNCEDICFPYTCRKNTCLEPIIASVVDSAIEKLLSKNFSSEIGSIKSEWLKSSLNILNLSERKFPDLTELNVYTKEEVKGGLVSFLKKHDINVVIKEKITIFDKLIRNIVAIKLSHPPVFVKPTEAILLEIINKFKESK